MKAKLVGLILLSIFASSILLVGIAWARIVELYAETGVVPSGDPITSYWLDYSTSPPTRYHIDSWFDNNNNGKFDEGDWIDTIIFPPPGQKDYWAVMSVGESSITVQHSDQWVPEFPMGLAAEMSLLFVVAYLGWKAIRNNRRTIP